MKYFFLFLLLAGTSNSYSQFSLRQKGPKAPVEGVQGILTNIPDSVTISRSDGAMFFFFYDFQQKTLFITEKKELYQLFVQHQKENAKHVIFIDGTIINPFTLFKKRELQKKAKRAGVELNGYKVCKIMSYRKAIRT